MAVRYRDVTGFSARNIWTSYPNGRAFLSAARAGSLYQEERRQDALSEQYVNELRFMFLEQIVAETPEAAAALFELRDAQAWQERYWS
jgi:hypothetical protein